MTVQRRRMSDIALAVDMARQDPIDFPSRKPGAMADFFGSDPEQDMPPFRKGSDTSREAAESIQPDVARREAAVFEVVAAAGSHGRSADEVADILGWEITSARPRITGLKIAGRIEDSGQRRKNRNNKNTVVWRVVR